MCRKGVLQWGVSTVGCKKSKLYCDGNSTTMLIRGVKTFLLHSDHSVLFHFEVTCDCHVKERPYVRYRDMVKKRLPSCGEILKQYMLHHWLVWMTNKRRSLQTLKKNTIAFHHRKHTNGIIR